MFCIRRDWVRLFRAPKCMICKRIEKTYFDITAFMDLMRTTTSNIMKCKSAWFLGILQKCWFANFVCILELLLCLLVSSKAIYINQLFICNKKIYKFIICKPNFVSFPMIHIVQQYCKITLFTKPLYLTNFLKNQNRK